MIAIDQNVRRAIRVEFKLRSDVCQPFDQLVLGVTDADVERRAGIGGPFESKVVRQPIQDFLQVPTFVVTIQLCDRLPDIHRPSSLGQGRYLGSSLASTPQSSLPQDRPNAKLHPGALGASSLCGGHRGEGSVERGSGFEHRGHRSAEVPIVDPAISKGFCEPA